MDKPVLPLNITADEVKYKILLVGKSGIGKTSTIAKLSGNEIPATHSETPGNHYPSAHVFKERIFFCCKNGHIMSIYKLEYVYKYKYMEVNIHHILL